MRPVSTRSTNINLVAPGCNDLPASLDAEGDHPVISTVWEPSAEERAVIAAGGNIKLTVWGTGHPPVRLETTTEKETP